MSCVILPCADHLPALLLVEPHTAQSVWAAQLGQQQYCVTKTDCALDIFLMQDMISFSVAVLSDQVGTQFLCSAAQNVRWQWPLTRIVILGAVPAAMSDQLYDDLAEHSVDETALLFTLHRLSGDLGGQRMKPPSVHLQGAYAQGEAARLKVARESDPTKLLEASSPSAFAHDFPAVGYRAHRRGHYAFPPQS